LKNHTLYQQLPWLHLQPGLRQPIQLETPGSRLPQLLITQLNPLSTQGVFKIYILSTVIKTIINLLITNIRLKYIQCM